MLAIIFILGLLFGSFAAALSYRLPRGESIAKGRSKCPQCHKEIAWFDNIPLFSYLALRGKCRHCHKKISIRYPIIELGTAVVFVLTYVLNTKYIIPYLSWPIALIFAFIFVVIFIIDWEQQIIPDELVFIALGVVFVVFLLTDYDKIFLHFFAGFASSLFLLLINLLTRGRGMGLGDVKLAIVMGTILGIYSINWMLVSFVVGGITGLTLIIAGRAKMADKIAFGPFLIAGFFVTLFGGILFDLCQFILCSQ
jgi:leader peptidase (prepilin peptidase)/N-methyltransferase